KLDGAVADGNAGGLSDSANVDTSPGVVDATAEGPSDGNAGGSSDIAGGDVRPDLVEAPDGAPGDSTQGGTDAGQDSGSACTPRSTNGCAQGYRCSAGACVPIVVPCGAITCPITTPASSCCYVGAPPSCVAGGCGGSTISCTSQGDCAAGQVC